MQSIFKGLCPNCGNDISDERLRRSLPCDKCIEHAINEEDIIEKQIRIGEYLKANNRLLNYSKIYNEAKALKEFEGLFAKAFNFSLRSSQREWAIRFLRGESFSIIAAPGLGKTHFGVFASVFNTFNSGKSYIIVPTHILVEQAYDIAEYILKRLGIKNKNVVKIHAKMKAKEREESIKAIEYADVLITTSSFLARRFDYLSRLRFNFVFVDDTDALLKRSKNAVRVLRLIGCSEEEIKDAINNIKARRFDHVRNNNSNNGTLIVSSATIKPRGLAPLLFRYLLGFDIGVSITNIRNIVDVYANADEVSIERLIKDLGGGGIVFVNQYEGEEQAIRIAELLKSKGIKAEAYVSSKAKPDLLERFKNGDIDVLVGVAIYYGILVRGLNIPERIRYTIFTSIPKIRFRFSELTPSSVKAFFTIFKRYIPKRYRDEAIYYERLSINSNDDLAKARDLITNIMSDKEFIDAIKENPIIKFNDDNSIEIPDTKTYIQASGRASRLYAGGVTKGLSIVIVDNQSLFKALEYQLRWYFDNAKFMRLDEVNLDSILREIDEDRKRLKNAKDVKDPVKTALIIVESPNKAETISRLLGKPARRRRLGIDSYEVTIGNYLINVVASKGHILDLVEEGGDKHGILINDSKFIPIYSTIKRCNKCSHQFVYYKVCPRCSSTDISDAMNRIERIRELASESDLVLIGTDPDREGEKIAWDLEHMIKPVNDKVYRIEFHEITARALRRAIDERKSINNRLVDAQMVRRMEDRLLGFELSKKLWSVFNNKTLSAGRVQTPVLGWIIDRFDKYLKSKQYVLTLTLENGFRFSLNYKDKPKVIPEELDCIIKEEVRELHAPQPFSTDLMLYEAFRQLHLNANTVMQLAQDLFELGLITYHRTDSIRVSNDGIELARVYILQRFGNYFSARTWSYEGAHECIRPTRPIDGNELPDYIKEMNILRSFTSNHIRLYSLIFKRFMASQMSNAKVRYQIIEIPSMNTTIEFPIGIEEEGFTRILPIKVYDRIIKGKVKVIESTLKKRATIYPYTQGELVRDMKEKGIGRPSTYSIIINHILEKRYAVDSKGFLIPTRLGRMVYEFLSGNYGYLVSEELTRELESKMDKIEEGKADPNNVLQVLAGLIMNIN